MTKSQNVQPVGDGESEAAFEKTPDSVTGTSKLVSSPKRANFQFVRDDWTLFRSISTLPQRTGVAPNLLRRLVVKELVDNALDVSSTCDFGETAEGGYYIQDSGPGLDPEQLADFFSIARPLISSKTLRLPNRGALGNGLRVVAGAVLSSGGTLCVKTRGHSVCLVPKDDGTTEAKIEVGDNVTGTRIEVTLGDSLPEDPDQDPLTWAHLASILSDEGTTYRGTSSAWWYGEDAFFELLQASGERSVRDLVSELDGCSGRKAGHVAESFLGRTSGTLTRDESAALLVRARMASKKVTPGRLGTVGRINDFPWYAKQSGIFNIDDGSGTPAEVPFMLEAWAIQDEVEVDSVSVCVNRTPITATVNVERQTKSRHTRICFFGCGLAHGVPISRTVAPIALLVNIQTPYMPITHEGKAPDLDRVKFELLAAIEKLVRKARHGGSNSRTSSDQAKAIIIDELGNAIAHTSGNGKHRYNPRQLWYVQHPEILKRYGKEPSWGYFCAVLNEHEANIGRPLPGIFRDVRGTLYIPHTGESIALGTMAVEEYQHRQWTFNKVLYIEKEGFFPLLKDEKWPERHDCALLTSKGQPTGAARDLLDILGDVGEEILFFCMHDADGPGTVIFEALSEATKIRAARRVRIINIGLEPEEALRMGLQSEAVTRKNDRKVAVASYVSDRWRQWLQNNRVELNAMTSPQILSWLDAKMEMYGGKKLVPPASVMTERLMVDTEAHLRARITERVLREAKVDGQVTTAFKRLRRRLDARAKGLPAATRKALAKAPTDSWASAVGKIAEGLAKSSEQCEKSEVARPEAAPGGRRKVRRQDDTVANSQLVPGEDIEEPAAPLALPLDPSGDE